MKGNSSMQQSQPNILGYLIVFLVAAIVIGFIVALIHGTKKGIREGQAKKARGEDIRSKLNRQNEELKTMVHNANNDSSEQLRKLKSPLDDGVITQDEFDKKKKQILGL